jgi:hypothetical protein
MSRPFTPILSVTDAACRLIEASDRIGAARQQADAMVAMLEARWAANRARHGPAAGGDTTAPDATE